MYSSFSRFSFRDDSYRVPVSCREMVTFSRRTSNEWSSSCSDRSKDDFYVSMYGDHCLHLCIYLWVHLCIYLCTFDSYPLPCIYLSVWVPSLPPFPLWQNVARNVTTLGSTTCTFMWMIPRRVLADFRSLQTYRNKQELTVILRSVPAQCKCWLSSIQYNGDTGEDIQGGSRGTIGGPWDRWRLTVNKYMWVNICIYLVIYVKHIYIYVCIYICEYICICIFICMYSYIVRIFVGRGQGDPLVKFMFLSVTGPHKWWRIPQDRVSEVAQGCLHGKPMTHHLEDVPLVSWSPTVQQPKNRGKFHDVVP